ncbi:putative metabolite transport protein [Glutamicibacter uratoxydans]|uniref:Putative metabolite transport protein n=1 Tax=Glutamicibacter uratoxydans TaxID=43667 RepID=A0A4Y4DK31_GLUUR|nr:MFS transporter [Glutamicibacter uratoxydans]GED05652.1 putative metabolite transport protein [Glutamicibacter uratoxydans]
MSTQTPASPPAEKSDKYARKAVFAAAIGYGLDGFDLLILSFALTGITASFGLSNPQAGSLATLTLLGAVLGGFVFGVLADRFGRVKILTYSVLIFAVFTGLSAVATGFWDMAAYRFIAGIGIGGEFGIGMTLAAEAVPARWRARATSWVGIGFQCGVLAAALISAPVIAAFGWRALFVIGAIPAVFAMFVRKGVEEPEKFAASDHRPSLRQSLAPLVNTPAARRISLAMIILTSVQNFGYFGIMTWLPTYLAKQYGMTLTGSSLWTAVTVAGMMVGIIAFGQVADRVSRRAAFWIFQIGAAVSVLAYSQITNHALLMAAGFVMGAFANGTLGGYGALLAELYPTHARATAQNVLFNIGRGVGGFAPLVIALLAQSYGFPAALAMLPVIYLLGFCAMFLIPERRGAELS